jgi:hemolysin activation/secretion protein
MKAKIRYLLCGIFILSLASPIFAQFPEELDKAQREIEKEKQLRERIEKEKPKVDIEDTVSQEAVKTDIQSTQKVVVKNITLTGVTILSEEEITEIISPYQGQELMLKDMQKVADLITDAYRGKGYITSRAYLPPQKIKDGELEIRVLEGFMGDIEVKGNKYFKTKLLKSKIQLKKGEPFNYNTLRENLSKINEQPDRTAKAVLVPGKETGATDIVLEIKDKLPIHLGLDYDNFGSRYIEKKRYRGTLTHNNLLGFDDILTIQYQMSEADRYWLSSARYQIPLTDDFTIGFFGAKTRVQLGKEYKDLNARAKSKLYGAYTIHSIVAKENLSVNFNTGFDYKDIFNFLLGEEVSMDKLRVAKIGLDFDLTDNFGRTILTDEVGYGIPHIMGGMDAKDDRSSRNGAGGKFLKNTLNFIRLQKMPFESTLLWKNQVQFTPYTLPTAEQFQIGGIANVRGFPPAEAVGDRGFTSTVEMSFPAYLVPKNIMVPFTASKLYNSIRVVTFYDIGYTHLRKGEIGEKENATLQSAGCGLRFFLPNNFSIRAEVAWPTNKTPSDDSNMHSWFEVSKTF